MAKKLKAEAIGFNPRQSMIIVVIVIAASYLLTFALPDDPKDFGAWSVIPAIFLIVYIFITKRIIESLVLASIMGFIMIGGVRDNILQTFSDSLLKVMMSEDIAWLIIVCGLMGSIISLIQRAGGAYAFAEWASTKARTRTTALMWSWVLGIVIFIDDYLNSLTVGSCMAPLTDKHKVPREMLAYVVDSTAAPLCVLIPISTWAVFCGRLLESNGWAPKGDGLIYFIKTIPFNFYGWLAALIVPLVILGVIPKIGAMKKAEERVANDGPLAPEGSDKMDILSGSQDMKMPDKPKIINFLLPIIVLVASTVIFDVDMQMGVLCTLAFMFVFYLAQKLMTAEEFCDVSLVGLGNMIMPLMLMVLAFLFAEVNTQIGFTKFCITAATNVMTPALMPVIIFIVLACTEFITGTNWGMYVIALPIVIPLAQGMGVYMPLAVSAVLSAGVFGSHICFYSDATVLTSAATGCNNFSHAFSQMPYGLIGAGCTAVLFLIFGMVMA